MKFIESFKKYIFKLLSSRILSIRTLGFFIHSLCLNFNVYRGISFPYQIIKKVLEEKDILSAEERIKYYLGNVNQSVVIDLSKEELEYGQVVFDERLLYKLVPRDKLQAKYFREMKEYLFWLKYKSSNSSPKSFLIRTYDDAPAYRFPTITKTRPINQWGMNVILPFNNSRHWGNIYELKGRDIDYENKKDIIFWRGVATGEGKRVTFIEQHYNLQEKGIDVGFISFDRTYTGQKLNIYKKNQVSLKEQLKYKFLVSIEGYDVASNLKWVMASNSLCIKTPSKNESWFMESKLIPWVHYVPIEEDCSDLMEKYQWCLLHSEKCKEIIKNANKYVAQFLDKDTEEYIITKVLEGYEKNINIYNK